MCVHVLSKCIMQRPFLCLDHPWGQQWPNCKGDLCGGRWPLGEKVGMLWFKMRLKLRKELRKIRPWNSRWKPGRWTLIMDCGAALSRADCYSVMDIEKYDTSKSLRTWSTMLYTMFSFYKPWPYSFSHALNDQRSYQSAPINLIWQGLSIVVLKFSCVFTVLKDASIYSLSMSHVSSVWISFYFQGCPVWLQWPQDNHLANISCPKETNKVDISDTFSFIDVNMFCVLSGKAFSY